MPTVATGKQLLDRLIEIRDREDGFEENNHIDADQSLLDYIRYNSICGDEIAKVFESIDKWYA